MIFFFAIAIPLDAIRTQTLAFESTGELLAGLFQIVWRVDAERNGFHDHRVNPHAVFECAQLLQLIAVFPGRGWQLDEPLQRRAAIGIEPYMMIVRSGPGRGPAPERFLVDAVRRNLWARYLDDVRIVRLGGIGYERGEGGDIDVRLAERLERGADVGRGDGRQIALHIDDDLED